ncbi:somatostatin receptor type 2-like [Saccoglossus kowalevskii]
MLVLSIERYIAVCRPMKFRTACTVKTAIVITVLTWVVCSVFMLPLALQSSAASVVRISTYGYDDYTIRTFCLTEIDSKRIASPAYYTFLLTAFLVTPILTAIPAYLSIIYKLRKTSVNMNVEHISLRKRLSKMMIWVLLVFIISWLPFICMSLVSASGFRMYRDNILCLYLVVIWFVFVGYAINPYIYIHYSDTFRNQLRKLSFFSPVSGKDNNVNKRFSVLHNTTCRKYSSTARRLKHPSYDL